MASSANEMAMFLPLVIGVAATFATIVIHGLAVMAIVNFARHQWMLGRAGVWFWTDLAMVAGAVLVALAAHLVEIALWALVLELCGEFPHFVAALYDSMMSYTTLGAGDLSPSWKFLGPLEAGDGILMAGVSTGMVFAVIEHVVQTRFPDTGN